jgi:hypothetical protein
MEKELLLHEKLVPAEALHLRHFTKEDLPGFHHLPAEGEMIISIRIPLGKILELMGQKKKYGQE